MYKQQPSLALVPEKDGNASRVTVAETASQLGPHDTLRHGVRSLGFENAPKHPIENRVKAVSLVLVS